MGWMGAAVLVMASAGLGEGTVSGQQTASLPRLRSVSPVVTDAITLAARQSPTFRDLLARISVTDGIIFIDEGVCSLGVRACLHLAVTIAGPYRALFIQVDPKKLTGCRLLGALGHEMQHAIEVLSDSSIRDAIGIISLYQRIGPTGSGRFETAAAVNTGQRVEREACRARR